MRFYRYVLTVQHDRGTFRLATVATSQRAAVGIVMACEGCPRRAIVAVRRGRRIA